MANKKTLIWESNKQKLIDSNKLVATETANGSGDFNMLFPVTVTGGGQYTRLYQFENGSLYYTRNAYWDDANTRWTADDNTLLASAFSFDPISNTFHIYTLALATSNWTTWDTDTQIDSSGVTTSPGQIDAYFGIQGHVTVVTNVGTGINFQKSFPSYPSSYTVTPVAYFNIDTPTITAGFAHYPFGSGIYASTLTSGAYYMYGFVTVS